VIAGGVATDGKGDEAEQDKKRAGKRSRPQIEAPDDIAGTEHRGRGTTAQDKKDASDQASRAGGRRDGSCCPEEDPPRSPEAKAGSHDPGDAGGP
jgi:hypothetical protein